MSNLKHLISYIRGFRSVLHSFMLVILTAGLFLIMSGCDQSSPESISETGFALGTTCSVKLYGSEYSKYLAPALEIASEIETQMSAHTEDSEIAGINRNAGRTAAEVSEETFQLIRRAKKFSALSEGIFDLTVGPLVELWDIGSGEEQIPSQEALSAALIKVDFRNVQLKDAAADESELPKVFLQQPYELPHDQ